MTNLDSCFLNSKSWNVPCTDWSTFIIHATIPGQGPEGHLVLDFKTEVGPPVQIQKPW